ncbi:glycosyltransferase family 2 protein [Pseudoalteromonas sp. TAE56]|uniref:glycosyltransferase family 2 protein n=1 Tax=Pseudoalteromonas sp. TAE56 TaxID=1938596 RepID=UPI0004265799|nr:glycosyltransferase family 2 protein [Pseudoalteromonas sp. TAE56]
MPNNQTVAVIIAAYNAEKTLERAIESSVDDEQVSQIIVVDDCSIDKTLEIALRYESLHDKVSVHSTGINSGPSKARNIALKHCSCDWVTVLDSDDFIEKGRYQKLLANSDGYQLVGDDQYRVIEGQPLATKTKMMGESQCFPCEITLSEFIVSNISKKGKKRQELGFIKPIIKRDFLIKHNLSYQENMRLGEDYELYCRCLALGAKLKLIEACGYVALVRANSLSGNHSLHDLIQLRDCDYKMAVSLPVTVEESQLLRLHADSINFKIQWIEFYTSLKKRKIVPSLKALFNSFSSFIHIIAQLKSEFIKRFLKRATN